MFYTSARVRKNPKDKAFYGVLSYKDEHGKWKQKSKKFSDCPTKTEAKRRLVVWREEMEKEADNRFSKEDFITYAERLVSYKVALRTIQPATEADYRKAFRAWKPYLKDVPLSQVAREHIEHGMQEMIASGLSVNTVIKRQIALSMVFEYAVKKGDVATNIVRDIPRPKREKPTINALVGADLDRAKARLSSLALEWWVVGVALCLYAGLRAEETCGLKLSDVDLDNGVLWIRRAIGHGVGGTYVAPPKNNRVRDVPICAALHEYLSKWVSQTALQPTSWLLGNGKSEYRDSHIIGKKWSMLCEIEGYKGLAGKKPTLHDLRHTFATLCIAQGMDVKTLQSILGHASAAITLDVYATTDPQAKQNAVNVINTCF